MPFSCFCSMVQQGWGGPDLSGPGWLVSTCCATVGQLWLRNPSKFLNHPFPPMRSEPQPWVPTLSPRASFRVFFLSLYLLSCHTLKILCIESLCDVCLLINPEGYRPWVSTYSLITHTFWLLSSRWISLHCVCFLSYRHATWCLTETHWDHMQPGWMCACKALKPRETNTGWRLDLLLNMLSGIKDRFLKFNFQICHKPILLWSVIKMNYYY